ncbi:hypothetical protein [Candidatus Neptunichlamydia sp. REUL1]|uniref:hypothetical protein n=1 Tax=Candidatus Neptunichlamydia sp. REUL1 TaxID=3064277 RepID=UPI00292D8A70|nr:hypothetical protein [Candidatus Neptunochlamydia sp. REUL1]
MEFFSKLFPNCLKKNEWSNLDEISTYKKTDKSVFHDKLLEIIDNVSKNLNQMSKSEIEKSSLKIGNYFIRHLNTSSNSADLDKEATEILCKCIKVNAYFKQSFFRFLRQQPSDENLNKYKWVFSS